MQDIPDYRHMPYRCGDCDKYFGLRAWTVAALGCIVRHKGLVATCLLLTQSKAVATVQLAEDLGVQ